MNVGKSPKGYDNWSDVYDLFYSDVKEDIGFYLKKGKKTKGTILEIGCGTGRIYLELLKEGLDVYGIDLSESMLKFLELKAEKQNLTPKVYQADMKTFNLGVKFDLIMVPFRSFLHNVTVEDQLKSLTNIRNNMNSGGRLVLTMFYPNPYFISKFYGKETSETITKGGQKYTMVKKSEFVDPIDQKIKINHTLYKNDKIMWNDTFNLTFIYKKELDLILEKTGYSSWNVYGGYNYEKLESFDQEMVWIIEK